MEDLILSEEFKKAFAKQRKKDKEKEAKQQEKAMKKDVLDQLGTSRSTGKAARRMSLAILSRR